jgi:hypothetical protein
METNTILYTQDFYAWTQEQAARLEARQFDALDIINLVDEVLSLGASERRALGSHLIILVLHLLKWRYQPDGRLTSHSWSDSIRNARIQIDLLVETSPSLRPRCSPGSTLKKKKGQTSDQCGSHHHTMGGLAYAKTPGLGPTVP